MTIIDRIKASAIIVTKKVLIIFTSLAIVALLLISQPVVYANHTANGPVGNWRLDEGSGTTTVDSSGHNNNGTLVQTGTGSPTWVSPGHDGTGSALKFDGTGAYASAQNTVNLGNDTILDQLDNYTISIWVKFDPGYVGGGGTWANLFGRTSGSDWAYMIYINSSGTIRPHHRNSNGSFVLQDSATVMPIGEWVHIEQVADGSNLRLYINGEEDPNFPIAYSGTTMSLPGGNVYIGQDTRESAPLVTISEVKIFNQAITAPGGVRNGLTAWQKANDGTATGGLWSDSSGNGNDAAQGTASAQPTLLSSGINFNPALNFDGSNDYLAYSSPLGVGGSNNFSSLVALRPDDYGSNYFFFGNNGGIGNNFLFTLNIAGAFGVGRGGNSSGPSCGATTTTTLPAGIPGIGSYTRLTGTQAKVELNGGGDNTGPCATNFAGTNRLLGRRVQSGVSGGIFDGAMGEFIHYNRTLTDAELLRIQSYLAIKYGVTLDQTAPTNYVASDGTTIPWNAATNGTYKHNITGIGRDDSSALNQKQSRSQNAQGIVTVGHGTIETDNLSNTNDFTADRNFLMFGDDNNSATTWADTGATNTTLMNYQRLPRTWKVQETGTVGNVTIALDTADPDADVPAAISGYYLLRDSDNDASFTDETPILMTDTGGGQFSVGNINFNNGELFTFATLVNTYTVEIQVVDNITGEDGDTGTFKVRLGARPSAAVTIALSSSNTDEGTVPASITIQPDDWDNFDANVVTVTGVDDAPPVGDGAVAYTIITGEVTSTDPNFGALEGDGVEDVAMFNQNNDPPGINVSLVGSNATTEAGGCVAIRFILLSQPTGAVTIPLSINDTTEGTLAAVTQITIEPADWDQPQNNEVSVCGVDDALTDGDILYQLVTGNPTSSDGGYDAITADGIAEVSLTNIDNDSPGVTVTQTSGSTNVTEGGATDTFTVVLNTQPAPGNIVVVNLQSDGQLNLGNGVATAIQLTFNNTNWNIPQIVTVTANNDNDIEDGHSGFIDIGIHASTTESVYLDVNPVDITVQITDNDEDDGDGVPIEIEDAAPNDGDANDDGTLDSQQRHVASFVNELTNSYSTLEVDNSCQINTVGTVSESILTVSDPAYSYPYGLMNFQIDCGTSGFTATVRQYYFGATMKNFTFRKHNPNNNAYFTVKNKAIEELTIGGQVLIRVNFKIIDGSVLDIDAITNGIIIDPSGLALNVVGVPSTGFGGKI